MGPTRLEFLSCSPVSFLEAFRECADYLRYSDWDSRWTFYIPTSSFSFSPPTCSFGPDTTLDGTHPAPLAASQQPLRKILVLFILVPVLETHSTPEIMIVQHRVLIIPVPNILQA